MRSLHYSCWLFLLAAALSLFSVSPAIAKKQHEGKSNHGPSKREYFSCTPTEVTGKYRAPPDMVEYFKDEFRGTKTCKTTDEDYCWIIKEYRDDLTANTGSFTRTYIQHGYTIGINISRSDGSFSRNSLHDEDGFRDSIDISGTCELKTETLKF